ncbi:NAD(P)-binding protein [Ramicandelaber brevisporus]|nr:NAD(P)-binding protein [Ramicandelaber brevisporus]
MSAFAIPKHMRAIPLIQPGGPEVLKVANVPAPDPSALPDGALIMKNTVAGLNFIEVYHRERLNDNYALPKGSILGRESAGIVVASRNPDFKVGDRVVQYNNPSYAEYTQINKPKLVWKLKDSISDKVAAASLLQGLTALGMMRTTYEVKPGQTVLVTAAAGGTGQKLIQVAKHLGATVIGTVSSKEKEVIARGLGADHVIITPRGPPAGAPAEHVIASSVHEITGGRGVDAVFDGVGKDTFDVCLASLKRRGSMISFGNTSGLVDPVPLGKLNKGNYWLTRPSLHNNVATREEFEKLSSELFELIEANKLTINIHKEYDGLESLAQAHIDLQSGSTTGKLVANIH